MTTKVEQGVSNVNIEDLVAGTPAEGDTIIYKAGDGAEWDSSSVKTSGYFRATSTDDTSQTLSDDDFFPVFDVVELDQEGGFNTTTGEWVVPKDGLYYVQGKVTMTQVTTGSDPGAKVQMGILVDGVNQANGFQRLPNSGNLGTYITPEAHAVVSLLAGQVVRLRINSSGNMGSTTVLKMENTITFDGVSGSNKLSSFSAYRIADTAAGAAAFFYGKTGADQTVTTTYSVSQTLQSARIPNVANYVGTTNTYTAPSDGIYIFGTGLAFGPSKIGSASCGLFVDGVLASEISQEAVVINGGPSGVHLLKLTSGQTVQCRFKVSSTTNTTVGGDTDVYFWGYRATDDVVEVNEINSTISAPFTITDDVQSLVSFDSETTDANNQHAAGVVTIAEDGVYLFKSEIGYNSSITGANDSGIPIQAMVYWSLGGVLDSMRAYGSYNSATSVSYSIGSTYLKFLTAGQIVRFGYFQDTNTSFTALADPAKTRLNVYKVNTLASETETAVNETTASNLGTGQGVFASKLDQELRFKSLVAGSGITLGSDANEIKISSSSSSAFLGFRAKQTSAQVVTAGSQQKINYNIEIHDVINGFNPATAVFTVPVGRAGYYTFRNYITLNTAAETRISLFYKIDVTGSGDPLYGLTRYLEPPTTIGGVDLGYRCELTEFFLSEGQTVETGIFLQNAGGVSRTTNVGDAGEGMIFSGIFLGA